MSKFLGVAFAGVLGAAFVGVDYSQQSAVAGVPLGQFGIADYIATYEARLKAPKPDSASEIMTAEIQQELQNDVADRVAASQIKATVTQNAQAEVSQGATASQTDKQNPYREESADKIIYRFPEAFLKSLKLDQGSQDGQVGKMLVEVEAMESLPARSCEMDLKTVTITCLKAGIAPLSVIQAQGLHKQIDDSRFSRVDIRETRKRAAELIEIEKAEGLPAGSCVVNEKYASVCYMTADGPNANSDPFGKGPRLKIYFDGPLAAKGLSGELQSYSEEQIVTVMESKWNFGAGSCRIDANKEAMVCLLSLTSSSVKPKVNQGLNSGTAAQEAFKPSFGLRKSGSCGAGTFCKANK